MARKPPTEREVDVLIHGLKKNGCVVEAETIERLWDELKGYRDREAVSNQLMGMEGEYG